MLKILNENENFEELIKEGLTLVDFYADWCGPCKMLAPHLEELGKEYNIVKVNVDKHEELARKYAIMSIPALFLFQNGEVIDKKIGYQELKELREWFLSKV